MWELSMNQPDMNAIMAQAQQMQAQLQAAQQELINTTVTGEAGNGLVTLSMTGGGQVSNLTLSPEVVDPEDIDTLTDLILGAFEDANEKVQALADQKMGPLAQGMGGFGF